MKSRTNKTKRGRPAARVRISCLLNVALTYMPNLGSTSTRLCFILPQTYPQVQLTKVAVKPMDPHSTDPQNPQKKKTFADKVKHSDRRVGTIIQLWLDIFAVAR